MFFFPTLDNSQSKTVTRKRRKTNEVIFILSLSYCLEAALERATGEKPKEVPWGFPGGTSGKESTCLPRRCRRRGFSPQVGKIPWRRKWQPTPVFLPGGFYGQRSLVGYSPRGRKESDTTERLASSGLSSCRQRRSRERKSSDNTANDWQSGQCALKF